MRYTVKWAYPFRMHTVITCSLRHETSSPWLNGFSCQLLLEAVEGRDNEDLHNLYAFTK
jgi:hypothetical protein